MNILFKLSFTLSALTALSGCGTSQKALLPVDENTTMLSLWARQTGEGNTLAEARAQLRRPLVTTARQEQSGYTRTAENETRSQFRRLPNPDMVMYVFPHLTGDSGVPVPGYSTVFPFYGKAHYALPGERTEAL